MNSVLMDSVVRLAAVVDELMADDEYAREAEIVLESLVVEFAKFTPAERCDLMTHVERMEAEATLDPTASSGYRSFLAEFPTAFGLIEET